MTKTASILLVWAALLMLLGMTVAASTLLSGAIGLAVGLSIALVKTGLVSWRYMHLDEQPGLARLAAFGAAAWLTILFSLAGSITLPADGRSFRAKRIVAGITTYSLLKRPDRVPRPSMAWLRAPDSTPLKCCNSSICSQQTLSVTSNGTASSIPVMDQSQAQNEIEMTPRRYSGSICVLRNRA